MNTNLYSDNELHLMPYQDLRRLSILLQLPANIKKKYMISMIQAHQKGDECLKTVIANKVLEERKVKRMSSKKKQSKSSMGSTVNSQKINWSQIATAASAFCRSFPEPLNFQPCASKSTPAATDLSVSTQHEFETRFSYVAHYSTKDEITSGISAVIKEEAEVSRRNRSVMQQARKPTRKLSTVGKTEIMLPRNHSLTTPVRLMPQYERGFPCPGDYEFVSGLSTAKKHFQDLNYNYHFHGEFSNSLVPTTTHEMYRNEPYWHTREVYNNSLMPILSSLLTPSSVTINSSGYASQYTSGNSSKGPTSFQQGVYENYIKSNSIIESQAFQSGVSNSSTLILSNHHLAADGNDCNNNGTNYNFTRGNYLNGKANGSFEPASAVNDLNCQHCSKREVAVLKSSNENQDFLIDFYAARNGGEPPASHEVGHLTNVRDLLQSGDDDRYRPETNDMPLSVPFRPYESSSLITYKTAEVMKPNNRNGESLAPIMEDCESSDVEKSEMWEESESGLRKIIGNSQMGKDSFEEDGLVTVQTQKSFESDVSETSINFSTDADSTEDIFQNQEKAHSQETPGCTANYPRCRYSLGHDRYPETTTDSKKTVPLPPFLTTFCTNALYNRAYSLCKNSFTETTETHLNPIMTCTFASKFSSHSNQQDTQVNNIGTGNQLQRQWYYSYPEYQVPLSVDSNTYPTWSEYYNGMDSKMMAQSNSQNVQVVQCRTHGWHYLYSVTNSCN